MNLLDLFSGIGGFSLGLKKAGIKIDKHFNSDIDTYANAVYKYNFKDSKHVGSVTDIQGNRLPKIDIITFGSPCQDFSLAGRRSGMEGERSSLISEAIRLIHECRPSVFIWENVKGTFSSNNGEDFWAIIKAFTNIGGYRLEWQLLNTKWLLPQNRERIYLVGHLAEGHSKEVFPITKDDTRNHEVKFHGEKTKGRNKSGTNNKSGRGRAMYKVGDYRYDEGFREREDGDAPTQVTHGGGISGKTLVASAALRTWPRDKEEGVNREKRLEKRKDNLANTITGSVTDSMVVVDKKGNKKNNQEHAACLTGGGHSGGNHSDMDLLYTGKLRRLTPIECERLQGFPDNWTKFGDFDGKKTEISDTQRYKQCGNAVTVNIVEMIGSKLFRDE